jgi:hypothetical protein
MHFQSKNSTESPGLRRYQVQNNINSLRDHESIFQQKDIHINFGEHAKIQISETISGCFQTIFWSLQQFWGTTIYNNIQVSIYPTERVLAIVGSLRLKFWESNWR